MRHPAGRRVRDTELVPIDEITLAPVSTIGALWPEDSVRLLYTGTLGRKHSPLMLITLLDEVRAQGLDARLIVALEGIGADAIVEATAGNLAVTVLPFQRLSCFPASSLLATYCSHSSSRRRPDSPFPARSPRTSPRAGPSWSWARATIPRHPTVYQLAADMGDMGFIETNRALCMLSVLTETHFAGRARR